MRIALIGLSLVALVAFSPAPNPETPAELGERLFSDPLLSSDQSISCASCHKPEFGFADTSKLSLGVGAARARRHTPSITNMSVREAFFWDGRAATLEQQVLMPIQDEREMNLALPMAIDRLKQHPEYPRFFQVAFGQEPTAENLALALAEFVRTLETGNTAFDRYMRRDTSAMTRSQRQGRRIFNVKGKCFDCHFTPDFTGDEYRNIGLYNGKDLNDTGRFEVTKNEADKGKFKVPGLRNVAVTAPYMHDGRFKTLREVIDYYDQPDQFNLHSIGRDTLLQRPLNLTEQEKVDLEAFLNALTDQRWVRPAASLPQK